MNTLLNFNLTDLISSTVSVIALFFAYKAAIETKRIYQLEMKRDNSAQASKITAWMVADIDTNNKWHEVGIIVYNQSNDVIYNLRIAVNNSKSQPAVPLELDTLPPGCYYIAASDNPNGKADYLTSNSGVAKPWEYAIPYELSTHKYRALTLNRTRRITQISFTDCHNQHWIRNENGTITLSS